MEIELLQHMMDSLKDPFVFVDTDHVIRYMNKAAVANYAKWGGAALVGQSIFGCHKNASSELIHEIVAEMQNGLDERLVTNSTRHRVYMRSVRDGDGRLIGYYERYEPPVLRPEQNVEAPELVQE